jgi:hypothetical protein
MNIQLIRFGNILDYHRYNTPTNHQKNMQWLHQLFPQYNFVKSNKKHLLNIINVR